MFAICLAAVTTLGEDECQSVLEDTRPALYSRYRIATRQALTNAGFMSTSSPMTLRAYVLFLVSRTPAQVLRLYERLSNPRPHKRRV